MGDRVPSVVRLLTAPAVQTTGSRKPRTMRRPNHGVYLNRQSLDMDPRSMVDCLNVRIKDGSVITDGMGYENFPKLASDTDRINLDSLRVLFLDQYRSAAGSTTLILCNKKDVFKFNPGAGPPATVTYMTPRYSTGTASSIGVGTQVDGAGGTLWNTQKVTTPATGGYGNNVRAGDYLAFGDAAEVALDATWWRIASIANDTTIILDLNPGANGSGPYTIRQTLTGDNNDIFEVDTFQNSQDASPVGSDVYYMTQGVEMLSWNGIATEFSWFYPGFVGKNLLVHKQTLVFWNLTDGAAPTAKPASVAYSELNFPNNFTTNGAGRVQPADGVLDLLQVKPLGDQLACYFQGDIIVMQYVGAPLYWVARVAVPGVGLVAQRAMMDFGDYHEFLSKKGAYRFDGVTIEESMNQVFREVLRKANPNRIKQTYAYMDEESAEVIWSVPLATDGQATDQAPTTAYVEHYLEDVGPVLPTPMTIREWPFTAVGFFEVSDALKFEDFPLTAEGQFDTSALKWDDRALQSAFPLQIVGDDNGDVYIVNTTNTRNGGGYKSFAQFPRIALGDGEFKGLVNRIYPHTTRREGSSGYSLEVRLRIYDFPDGDSIASSSEDFDMAHQGLRYVTPRKGGRYGDVRFRTTGLDSGGAGEPQPWDVAGYQIKVSRMGER